MMKTSLASAIEPPEFRYFVVSLPGHLDAGLPIAGSRAEQGVGLLDLTYSGTNLDEVKQALDRLNRLARGPRGLIVRAQCGAVERAALETLTDADYVILVRRNSDRAEFNAAIEFWKPSVGCVGVVVSNSDDDDLASHPGIDLVIGKGNEAGGVVGESSTFVLLQRLIKRNLGKPVVAWGGIGLQTAAACRVAGAAGVVLDWQLALTRESPLPGAMRRRIERMDGTETVIVSGSHGKQIRVFHLPGMTAKGRLEAALLGPAQESLNGQGEVALERILNELLKERNVDDRLWLVGQDACLAARLTAESLTVSRLLKAFRTHVDLAIKRCVNDQTLAADGPLARSHGTKYPIVQGPMTRVSDVPEFCAAVERGGGLPFLALALMRHDEVSSLLARTQSLMGSRPWGVGILGFVPLELRNEQMAAICEQKPPFAIIAGGRPDQAAALEELGISTYLHVPSPSMLDSFLEQGARRFIFEGRECGGHVGPRSSFVLWQSMLDVLVHAKLSPDEAASVHVLFAGGICDGLSGAMVSALAQPLVERGMKVGVLLGTAYLFTHEAVATGAIVETFQEVALDTLETVLVESSPGHAIRCAQNTYATGFRAERARLTAAGKSAAEIREELEQTQVGRLRIASKGIARATTTNEAKREFVHVPVAEQRAAGMYMIGQIAPLCPRHCAIAELHESVSRGTIAHLERLRESGPRIEMVQPTAAPPALDIAIVGMSCLLPGADTLEEFWQNILEKRDVLERVPPDRFDVDRWYDTGRSSDKINSTSGGFLRKIAIDPLKFGIPPASLRSIEPVQILALELVDRALLDAGYGGYLGHNPNKERTSIILGAGGGAGELGTKYVVRAALPQYFEQIDPSLLEQLPEWTEDSFAGILTNVIAGRVANRFDLGGLNFTVDAACASSLAAIYLACRELTDGTSDMVIAGGCDTGQTPFGYLCFASAGALSPRGRSRPLDEGADGIAISEGLASIVLKRAADAERDGDRIYAVIRAAAGGSDGRSMGMTAPRIEGQHRTYQRAYDQARFSPATVELFEAHGTGTAVGDRTECKSLSAILQQHQAGRQQSAIGSVKSNIGHTKCTAGVAGLIKASLSLYHRVLPPTIHVESPDAEGPLVNGPLYVNTELRPWVRRATPRRAACSAFGFGGTNFHVVLEEYAADAASRALTTTHSTWPTELCLISAGSPAELAQRARQVARQLAAHAAAGSLRMVDVSMDLHRQLDRHDKSRAAILAGNPAELRRHFETLAAQLEQSHPASSALPDGIFYSEQPLGVETPLAMLFPGQGSQMPNMLRELSNEFDEVREAFARGDAALDGMLDRPLSRFVFPPPGFSDADRAAQEVALRATAVAQSSLGVTEAGVFAFLSSLGIRPAMTAGHSYGELAALFAAGAIDEAAMVRLSHARGRAMQNIATSGVGGELGSMLAVNADEHSVRTLLDGVEQVWIANLNGPNQTVISGTRSGIAKAKALLEANGLSGIPLNVACGFHSPLMEPARREFDLALDETVIRAPQTQVFANWNAQPFSSDPDAIRRMLSGQFVNPVRFVEMIEAMYQAGCRVFLEVGPQDVLSRLVRSILRDRTHLAVAMHDRHSDGLRMMLKAVGQLFAHGVAMDLERLFEPRSAGLVDLNKPQIAAEPSVAGESWLFDGAHVFRADDASAVEFPKLSVIRSDTMGRTPPLAPTRPLPESSASQSTVSRSNVVEPSPNPSYAPLPIETPAEIMNQPSTASLLGTSPAPNGDPVLGFGSQHDPMAQFQSTMRCFLETQQAVMTAYFGALPSNASASSHYSAPADYWDASPVSSAPPALAPVESWSQAQVAAEPVPVMPPVMEPAAIPNVAPVAIAVPAQTPPAAPAAELDLAATLIQIVSDRTGYPLRMLKPDIDLESELGIDSIKRVEIISAFRKMVVPHLGDVPSWFMERMTAAKSITKIAAGMQELIGGPAAAPPVAPCPPVEAPVTARESTRAPLSDACPRCSVQVIDAPLDYDMDDAIPNGVLLLTDDGHGLAAALRNELDGIEVHILDADALTSRDAATQAIDRIRSEHNRIAGLVHLQGLRPAPALEEIDQQTWTARISEEVGSALYLLQALAPELQQGCFFGCVTTGGGDFDKSGAPQAEYPWRGGLAGLLKCAAKEWQRSKFRAVDVDAAFLEGGLPKMIMRELSAEGPVEIGYRADERFALRAIRADLDDSVLATESVLNSNSVVLVTGGGRGITAEIAIEFAQRVQPTLILLGRSPQPAGVEDPRTASLVETSDLRRTLLAQAEAAGETVNLRDIESRVKGLQAQREIRRTLAAISAAGGRAEYISCDVRDSRALEQIVRQVQARHGAIHAIVHGAGVIEDKYIVDKTTESFERVVGLKTTPLFTLARLIDPDQLALCLLFSSVAGFYGNPGQSDYAAGNEILNRLAGQLQRLWTGKVVALNWGPWSGAGMVTPEVAQQFDERGIGMVTLAAGRRAAWIESLKTPSRATSVIIGPGPWITELEGASQLELAMEAD